MVGCNSVHSVLKYRFKVPSLSISIYASLYLQPQRRHISEANIAPLLKYFCLTALVTGYFSDYTDFHPLPVRWKARLPEVGDFDLREIKTTATQNQFPDKKTLLLKHPLKLNILDFF